MPGDEQDNDDVLARERRMRYARGARATLSLTRRAKHRHLGIIAKIVGPALVSVAGLFVSISVRYDVT